LKGAEKENHLGEGGEGYYNKILKNSNQHNHLTIIKIIVKSSPKVFFF